MASPHGSMFVWGKLDGTSNPLFGELRAATWNKVTALSSLYKELQELDATFQDRILPLIILFGNAMFQDRFLPSIILSP